MFLLLIVERRHLSRRWATCAKRLVLSFSLFVIFGITIFQERKTERALEALRDLSSPRALVIRDGEQKRIAGREVVRGDILILTEGDRVPADAVLLACNDLMVDESLLTGESVPVRKIAWDGTRKRRGLAAMICPLFTPARCWSKAVASPEFWQPGVNTEFGKIGKALANARTDETFLQKRSAVLIRNFAAVGLSLCVVVVFSMG